MTGKYRVARPQPPRQRRSKDNTLRPRAVFVAHGMGQQVPFETLDEVARGLCGAIEASGGKVESETAETVRVGCEIVQRLELDVRSSDGTFRPPIHLYEAYWAPLTEGAIGLWQVMRFILAGGLNALRSDARLHRFMFGLPRQFHVNRWSLAFLAVVIATLVAVLIVGGTISAVAVARLTFAGSEWANDALVRELTTLFELLIGVISGSAAAAIALVALSRLVKRFARIISALTVLPVTATVLALWFSAYLAIPVIFAFNEKAPFAARACEWCTSFGGGIFDWLGSLAATLGNQARNFVVLVLHCHVPETSAWWFLAGIGVVIVVFALHALVTRNRESDGRESRRRGGRLAGLALALLLLAGIFAVCGHGNALAFVSWLLLFGAVLFVRSFLIQYVGDVAIYVSPHVVDRFFDLRRRIRSAVWRTARAVYACPGDDDDFLYQSVVVVGHSLGSVIVYDVLNRLINEDDLVGDEAPPCCEDAPLENLRVSDRTRRLVTFGSPLDKTAFVFAQHDPHGGNERDALAASVQPLIQRERTFSWINLWTRFDILGGRLEFYDTPPRPDEPLPNVNRIVNLIDPHALTPFAAHTEFWRNPLLYEMIYDALRQEEHSGELSLT